MRQVFTLTFTLVLGSACATTEPSVGATHEEAPREHAVKEPGPQEAAATETASAAPSSVDALGPASGGVLIAPTGDRVAIGSAAMQTEVNLSPLFEPGGSRIPISVMYDENPDGTLNISAYYRFDDIDRSKALHLRFPFELATELEFGRDAGAQLVTSGTEQRAVAGAMTLSEVSANRYAIDVVGLQFENGGPEVNGRVAGMLERTCFYLAEPTSGAPMRSDGYVARQPTVDRDWNSAFCSRIAAELGIVR